MKRGKGASQHHSAQHDRKPLGAPALPAGSHNEELPLIFSVLLLASDSPTLSAEMSADGQPTYAQSSSYRRRSGRHLCLLGIRLLLAVSILTVLAWAFQTYQKDLYATYGRSFLLAANTFCVIGWIRFMAKIALRWRELKPARFRYGALALLLAVGLLWSSLLAAELFSFWGRNVSVDTIVPRPSEL